MMFNDDYMFPTTRIGQINSGCAVFEGANCKNGVCEKDEPETKEDILLEAAADFVEKDDKVTAMTAILDWVANGDFSYDALEETVVDAGDINTDEPDEDDIEDYNELWSSVADALIALKANKDDVMILMQGDDEEMEKAARRVGDTVSKFLDDCEMDDTELIKNFAFGAALESALESGFYTKKNVIRNGKLVRNAKVRKAGAPKAHLTSKQKAGLKKALRKAQSASAIKARKRSMLKRKKFGL